MTYALSIVDLTISFGEFTVLDKVTVNFSPGERHAILGPNGAGKTTLFNLITGDLKPTSGTIAFYGNDVTNTSTHKRIRLGMRRTYQSSLLFKDLTVRDNIFAAVRGIKAGRMKVFPLSKDHSDVIDTEKLIGRVHLKDVADKKVVDLSHGQQRQLEIGMAMAGEPKFILLDEPAAGLSPKERDDLVRLLEGLPSEIGFVIIEHDLDIALKVVEQVTVMSNGKIIASESPQEIVKNPQVQAIYMGTHDHKGNMHA